MSERSDHRVKSWSGWDIEDVKEMSWLATSDSVRLAKGNGSLQMNHLEQSTRKFKQKQRSPGALEHNVYADSEITIAV